MPPEPANPPSLAAAARNAREALLRRMAPDGRWEGCLSSSALATAVAVAALASVGGPAHTAFVRRGLTWLAQHQASDGGWGDTPCSPSNLSTTLLCWAAFNHAPDSDPFRPTLGRAEQWLEQRLGRLETGHIAERVLASYGTDRTFSVPILTFCALSHRLGDTSQAWDAIPQLPFELAALPHQLFKWARLPVVSYAIPALIAIGMARHEHTRHGARALRRLRDALKPRVLQVLGAMQPAGGGFLEAIPLTGFVVLALAASGLHHHPVAVAGREFLLRAVRADGSWPIDVNLSTWVTTLSIRALHAGPEALAPLGEEGRNVLVNWLLAQQHRVEHPFTHAAPGGWAWTDLPGGVPDADDTAGALLALHALGAGRSEVQAAAGRGVRWLLDLQNHDGGVPTFCRGWSKLPFDRSCPDITAHALAAWMTWRPQLAPRLQVRVNRAAKRALNYLRQTQRPDGTWIPLWFGNQHATALENPLYGTARVLSALRQLPAEFEPPLRPVVQRGQAWLRQTQQAEGGWGGSPQSPPTVEETALALDALLTARGAETPFLRRGLDWLLRTTHNATVFPASPIGLYFAALWYAEELYPVIFTGSALGRAARKPCNGW
jgi:squalene-hopene/tetraprenyl-beta-curcumene cyclase